MPETAEQYGINPSDPLQSIDGQGRYMGSLQKQFGNEGLSTAAYNWGPGNLKRWLQSGADPNAVPAETRNYVQSVTGRSLEDWASGAGGQSSQTQGQAAVSGNERGLRVGSTWLPSRDVMMGMLKNPVTRNVAATMLREAWKGDQSGFDFQKVGSSIVAVNKNNGQARVIYRAAPGEGEDKFGLNPIYGKDAQGNTVLLQLGEGGQVRQPQLPEGVQLTPGVNRVDLGTAIGILDRSGNIVSTIPKDVAGAASDQAQGKALGEAKSNLPGAEQTAQQMLNIIDQVKNAPGRSRGTGLSRYVDPRSYVPGGKVADFEAMRQQLLGQTFLQAYQSLKGAGAISEVEGVKAENAIARLGTHQSDQGFLTALDDLEGVVKNALNTARQRAGQSTGAPPSGGQPGAGGNGTTSNGVQWQVSP
jgi:hypothetical protein